ncbi:hypothetical protein B0T14DRAFT_479768 [Immersiella caudata]|uniref:DUF7779 domain-containing protein n=1 Tax=Immersiella caudata TaxID=314043 RepID=A0AA39WQ56_9PEZI|nr:hypothetical protein B0T14DRAFT_479768 [Immersiella caudata]
MRRLLHRRPKAGTNGSAAESNLPSDSVDSTSNSTKTFSLGIKPLHRPANAIVDIVFVHGLTGDREKTWTAPGATEPWPKTLLPSQLPTARILTFGYDAYVTDWRGIVSQNRINNHAWNLMTSLATYRERDETNERPIIFVCHSLGGLVCEDALVTLRQRSERHLQNILQSTRGIAFLGTPHHGSALARWAEFLSRSIGLIKQTNTEIVAILRRESEVLARIQDGFHTMVMARREDGLQPIQISCFYEELPLPGVGHVVPQDSAILPGYIPIGIHSNHMDMARFFGEDDPGFEAVCGELRRWIKHIDVAKRDHMDPLASAHNEANTLERLQDRPESPARFLVPYSSNPEFVGRSGILDQLKNRLGHLLARPDGGSHSRVSLYGLGGVGKTQIALAYVYWLQQTRPEVSVFWVHASSSQRFCQAYFSIAKECEVPDHDNPKADVLLLVKEQLERKSHGPWLMVIDNADDIDIFLNQPVTASSPRSPEGRPLARYIPECAHGSILVTTRNKEAGSRLTKGRRPIEVRKMDVDESGQLLRMKLEEDLDGSELVAALSSRLEYLPLAMAQAAAFIQEKSMSVSKYLELLDKSDQGLMTLLSEDFETEGRDLEAPRAVTETWILSFEQIQRQNVLASELMSFMSLLDRQAIPLEFLSSYSKQQQQTQELEEGELQLTKALGVLKAFSFINENKGGGNFDMHRLVQLVMRKWLLEKDAIRELAGRALSTVSRLYPYGNYENRILCGAYLSHAYAVLELKGTGSEDEKLAKALLLHRTAEFFDYQGQWKDAEKSLAEAQEIQTQVLGPEHPDTLTSMANLASTFRNQGRWAEAESLEVQAMEIRKRVLGPEHPDTLTSMANLASTYMNQGRWTEAESLNVQVMEIRKRVLGPEHPHTLTSMANLASTYWNQGRWTEAESPDVQVMEIRKRVLGPEHPDTLTNMANLASTYMNQGRWTEAESLNVQVMEIRKRVLGPEHPDMLTSMNNLAFTWEGQGRLDDALDLIRQCVQLRQRVLGPSHPDTESSLSALHSWEETSGHRDSIGAEQRPGV